MSSQRTRTGHFKKGHTIGKAHRFRQGQPSPNPHGRPKGVKHWVRALNSRRYHQGELEEIVADDCAPVNQREAAVRLLLPVYEQRPPKPADPAAVQELRDILDTWSTEDLRWVLADPREAPDDRAAAHLVLSQREALQPPPDRLEYLHRKSGLDRYYDRLMKDVGSLSRLLGGGTDPIVGSAPNHVACSAAPDSKFFPPPVGEGLTGH